MKKLFLLMAAAVCSLTMSAKKIYLDTGGPGYWGDADYAYFIWSWQGSNEGVATPMTHVTDNIFYGKISDEHDGVLFVCMPSGTTEFDWKDKIYQTIDYIVPTGDNNLFVISDWESGKAIGDWLPVPIFKPVCAYSIKMTDSWGDGWNGGYLTVEDNGVEQTFTLENGKEDWAVVNAYGGTPHWTWTAGGYPFEVGYGITDVNGLVLAYHSAGATHEAEFTTDDPCAARTVPAQITGLAVTEGENYHYNFTWDACSEAETYRVQIDNPLGERQYLSVTSENQAYVDLSDALINGDYIIRVLPADAEGIPYIMFEATLTFTVEFPALGDVKVRYYVPEYSEMDMSLPVQIRLQGTNNAWLEADATQEEGTRWWSATINMPDPAISYVDLYVGNGTTTRYGSYLWNRWTENTYCLTVGNFQSEDSGYDYAIEADYTVKWYDADVVDCDKEIKDYSIASATLTGGVGELNITVVPKENEAPKYRLYIYTGPTDALTYEGYVIFSGLTDNVRWDVSTATDVTYWVVTPLDETEVAVGPAYESYEVVTVQASPYVITTLNAAAVGDNTYKITWDYSDVVPEYYIYVADPNGNSLVSKYVKASELAVEGDKFVFITPAFGVEGNAYVYVLSVDEDGYERYYRYITFEVFGLVDMTDATIRVLIPTDNNMDISNGVWFWWWSASESGKLVKATAEGGRWFSADIHPNATGYQFLVVNRDVDNEGWTDAQQSENSQVIGDANACFAMASKYTYKSANSRLFLTDCSAVDHDYRPTLTFDNSVPQKITVTAEAKEYAPNYQLAWRVKDSGDDFHYDEGHHMTATDHTYTVNIPVTEDTEYEYRYFVNDENWYLMVEDINGTFTVKAGEAPDYTPTNLNAVVDGKKVTFTWNAPIEVEYCVFNLLDPETSTDVVYTDVYGVSGAYTYEYTFADGDERTLEWGVFSRIGISAVSGWVYGTPVKAEGTILTSAKIRVLIPTDNNMNIDKGVWFWWWKVGEAGQLVKATEASGRWFEAEIVPDAAGYQFLVVNRDVVNDGWEGAEQTEDSPIITSDEACFEQLYTIQPGKWVLAADGECDNVDHDYRFTVTVDNSVAGRLTFDITAVDYAPVYRVGVRPKDSEVYSWTNLTKITASSHAVTFPVGMPEDAEYVYRVYAYNNDKWQLADRVEGEITVLANADVPVDLKAEVNGKDVTFTWTPRGTAYTDFRLKIYDETWTLYFDEGYIYATTKTVTIEDNGNYHWALDVYGNKEYLGGTLGPDFTVNYVPVSTYTLTIAAGSHGKVNDEVNGTYDEGTVVKIIATPDDGYEFDKWSDGDTHASRNITMNKDYDLKAYFVEEGGGGGDDPEYYTLTVVVDPKGKATVYFDGETVKNNKLTVEEGTSVTLTLEEEEGYEFDYWEDGKSTISKAKYKVTVDEDKTVVLHLIEAQDIHNVEDVTAPTKFLRDGTIYILRDGRIYTISGSRVE